MVFLLTEHDGSQTESEIPSFKNNKVVLAEGDERVLKDLVPNGITDKANAVEAIMRGGPRRFSGSYYGAKFED